MKRLELAVAAILIMGSCNQNNLQEATRSTRINSEIMEKQEKQRIEALLRQYEQAWNHSDAELAQSLYTKDGIFMPTEAPSGIGSEGILRSYEYVFSQIQLNIEFFIEEIQVEGTMAFAVTSSKGTTLVHATGDTLPEANR